MRAVIFDFDGLILDTESPEYRTFVEMYREYGAELPLREWARVVGAERLEALRADLTAVLRARNDGRLPAVRPTW